MRNAIINIGLNIGDGSRRNMPGDCIRALHAEGVIIVGKTAVVNSDSEPTLVATVVLPEDASLYAVSRSLQQEAVAVYYPDSSTGALVGPMAAAWGTFDPSMFFLRDGKRLSELEAD
jgi:hypothetical protein